MNKDNIYKLTHKNSAVRSKCKEVVTFITTLKSIKKKTKKNRLISPNNIIYKILKKPLEAIFETKTSKWLVLSPKVRKNILSNNMSRLKSLWEYELK